MTAYDAAFRRTEKGKTTGPASRLLSGLNLLLYVYILVTLFEDHQYISLVVLVILAFTPIAPLGMVGVAIYFALSGYWEGFGLLVLSSLLGWSSVRFGVRYNEKRVQGQSALVDPFEHMPEIAQALFIQVPFFGLALLTSGILSAVFWVLFALVTGFLIMRYSFRLQSGWARLHYSLMLRSSALAGSEAARAHLHGEDFSMQSLLPQLVQSVYPAWSQEEVDALINAAHHKMVTFGDRSAIESHIRARNPLIGLDELDSLMARIGDELKTDESGSRLLSWTIAEVVERQYGDVERTEYLAGLISGRIT